MMRPSGQLRQELLQAEKKLYETMQEHFTATHLAGTGLQLGFADVVREQQIVIYWLRAEYTARLLQEQHEKIGALERDVSLGDAGPGAQEKIEKDRRELNELRARHREALDLFNCFEDRKEVVDRYELSLGT